MASKTCNICGRSSGMYPLCPSCFKLRDEGKIVQCSDCKTWYKVQDGHKCGVAPMKVGATDKNASQGAATTSTNCILCGNTSNGKLFCNDCHRKYKDKELFVKIVNCADFTIFDAAYEGRFTCADGHIVKSKSEMLIDNYFYEKKIFHVYEKELQYSATEALHPDFYLPDRDIYIEHWGIDASENYKRQKKYKLEKYAEQNLTIICTYEADISHLDAKLGYKIQNYEKGEINYL